MTSRGKYFAGLMSGTSLDGMDAVLADFSRPAPLLHHHHLPYGADLRDRLLALHHPGQDELHRAALLGNELAHHYAAAVAGLLAKAQIPPAQIGALGCHGQTVRHRPERGYSIQLVNGALLAELAGIRVVCDFRSRDIAAGGQGAPLVPAFHRALFHQARRFRVIVNIGGIANLTALPPSGVVAGFDCGPGNMLLDAWTQRHLGQPFDSDGSWARSGKALPPLLHKLLEHEYFRKPPPKSAGRENFNLAWLEQSLTGKEAPQDVQATLLQLTANSIAQAVRVCCDGAEEVYLCGGGARNSALANALRGKLPGMRLGLSDDLGVRAEHVEALAFAWLARQTLAGQPGNCPAVTGARGERVLGAVYPA